MKTLMLPQLLLLLAFLVSCANPPKRSDREILKDWNSLLQSKTSAFRGCLRPLENDVSIHLSFKLFDTQVPFLQRPHKLAYNPKTNEDEIVVSIMNYSSFNKSEVECVKSELKKLDFGTISPIYSYLIYHDYQVTINGMLRSAQVESANGVDTI